MVLFEQLNSPTVWVMGFDNCFHNYHTMLSSLSTFLSSPVFLLVFGTPLILDIFKISSASFLKQTTYRRTAIQSGSTSEDATSRSKNVVSLLVFSFPTEICIIRFSCLFVNTQHWSALWFSGSKVCGNTPDITVNTHNELCLNDSFCSQQQQLL